MSTNEAPESDAEAFRVERAGPPWHRLRPGWALVAIVAVGAALRTVHLGRLSLWYDEVVPMRLARQESPAALLDLLHRIDATRAPLHPLLLRGWLALFGTSEVAGRSLSAACGVLTIVLVFWVGRQAYGVRTALWAAWLCALCPVLVRWSREVRMYACLAAVCCLAWGLLLSLRRSAPPGKQAAYAAALAAMVYLHPLGLLMVGALGLAYLVDRPASRLFWPSWLAGQAAVVLAITPWIFHYLRNSPTYPLERYPIRFLIGMPIGFIGGDSRVLLVCLALIAWGLILRGSPRGDPGGMIAPLGSPRVRPIRLDHPREAALLLIWFSVPPVVLYVYSLVRHPVFGPDRYTQFVAPAYLLLVARGLVKLPPIPRFGLAAAGAVLSALLMQSLVFDPEMKADWRAASAAIARAGPGGKVVILSDDRPFAEVAAETARYYLGPATEVIVLDKKRAAARASDGSLAPPLFFVVRKQYVRPATWIPEVFLAPSRSVEVRDFPGLRLLAL